MGRIGRPPTTISGGRAIVRNGIEDLARVLHPGVDDLQRWNNVFGGPQDIGETNTRALQRRAKNESKFDFDARRAVVGVRYFGAVSDHHIIEQMPIVGLVDLRRLLHRLGREPDLVPDQLATLSHLLPLDLVLDRVSILERDRRPGGRELHHRLAITLSGQQELCRLLAVRIG